MRKINFNTDPNAYQSRKSGPLPYFVTVPPPPPPPPARARPSSSSSSEILLNLCLRQIKNLDETTNYHHFNPHYYKADKSWEIRPQECVVIFFDHVSDYYTSENEKNWNAYCLKRHVFFVLHNKSCTNSLRVPLGTSLMDILLMPDIMSYMIPASRTFVYSEKIV
jgi:hypothetical protein